MIKKISFRIKNKGYEERLFLQFMCLVTFPLIIMGLLSYHIYSKGEVARNKLTLEYYSENILHEFENIFSPIREYYLDKTRSSVFNWLIRQTEVPYAAYNEVMQAQQILQGNYFMSKYISMYNFINVKEGWVLNNYGMYPYEKLKNKKDVDDFIELQKEESSSIYWLNRSGVTSPYGIAIESGLIDTSGKMLLIKNEQSSGNIKYLLFIKLNMEELNNISGLYQRLGYDITVLSKETVLFESSTEFTNAYLNSENAESGQYQSREGRNYNTIVSSPASSGLTYIIGYNTSQEKSEGTVFIYAAIFLIIVIGILLFLIRIMAKYVSKPFVLLQKFSADQEIQIRELYVTNLIKGVVDNEKADTDFLKYNMQPCHCYRMIGLICKDKEQESNDVSIRKDNLQKEILSKLPISISESLYLTPVIHEKIIVFLIGDESEETIDFKTAFVYKQIKDFIAEVFSCQTASGISMIFHALPHAARAYNECMEVLYTGSNLSNSVSSTLVLYDDYSALSSAVNVYDIIMENELCRAIEECNEAEAKELLILILQRLEIKGVFGIERNFYITRLLMAILAIPGKSSISLSDIFEGEQQNILNKSNQIYNVKRLTGYLEEEIIRPIISSMLESRNLDVSDLTKQVIKILKENKGNITLYECAEMLSYHPNYISRLLKKEKGLTFTDMANTEKIKAAKYMLLTTEYSISEISNKLQYNNVQNFIRFFKNQLGITPSVFRKEHQKLF